MEKLKTSLILILLGVIIYKNKIELVKEFDNNKDEKIKIDNSEDEQIKKDNETNYIGTLKTIGGGFFYTITSLINIYNIGNIIVKLGPYIRRKKKYHSYGDRI